ncbi:hypothetical protein RA280_29420 [Cupriavidus sp. CV2]|uniref:hypothetical protein n=1 Tax=Cupriavidus ulmosensis TaxID=3065913 RepID=UPI00296B2F9B|nr:hypothetical protein [Cupriavidus sp. CV2]MDW3685784.1 hypothetical protein [Cupriavidus sp. CV2]
MTTASNSSTASSAWRDKPGRTSRIFTLCAASPGRSETLKTSPLAFLSRIEGAPLELDLVAAFVASIARLSASHPESATGSFSVETPDDFQLARRLGAEVLQGYLIGVPEQFRATVTLPRGLIGATADARDTDTAATRQAEPGSPPML